MNKILGSDKQYTSRMFLLANVSKAEIDSLREEVVALRVKVEARDRLIAKQREELTRLQNV